MTSSSDNRESLPYYADTLELGKQQGSVLETDIALFYNAAKRMLAVTPIEDQPPEGSKHFIWLPKSPFSTIHMTAQLERRAGMGVHFVNINPYTNEPTDPTSLVEDMSIYVDEKDMALHDKLHTYKNSSNKNGGLVCLDNPLNGYLYSILSADFYLNGFKGDPGQPVHNSVTRLEGQPIEDIVEFANRAALTSTIIGMMGLYLYQRPNGPNVYGNLVRHDKDQYDQLRESGIVPFGLEELYGIGSGLLTEAMKLVQEKG